MQNLYSPVRIRSAPPIFSRRLERDAMKKSLLACAYALLFVCLPVSVAFGAQGAYEAQRFEPTVSRQESELLTQAQGLAETNAVAAIDLIEQSLEPGSSAALDFALGNFQYQRDNLEAAAQAYRAAIEKLPAFKSAIANLGRVYLLQDKPEMAIDLYRKLIESGIASSEHFLLLGQAHLLNESPLAAEGAFRQVLLLDPGNDSARRGLAKCLLEQERYRESNSLVKELLKDKPEDSELWSLRSNLALALAEPADALAAIEGARRLGLASPQMLATMGDIYLNRGQAREALEAYRESFAEQAPSFERRVRAIGGMIAIGELGAARDMIRGARESDEDLNQKEQLRLLELEAELALARGDDEKARERYESILKLNPLQGEALLGLAEIDWRGKRLESALISCERAARIDGFAAPALVLQAQIEVERGNYGEAVELLERAQAFREQVHVERYLEQLRRLAE